MVDFSSGVVLIYQMQCMPGPENVKKAAQSLAGGTEHLSLGPLERDQENTP
jgi:hypothetical protein